MTATVNETTDQRLERIENHLERLTTLVASATETFDDVAHRWRDTDAPADARIDGLLRMVDVATQPETTEALATIAPKLDVLVQAMAAMAELPLGMAAVTDILDELAAAAAANGAQLDVAGLRLSQCAATAVQVLGSPSAQQGPERVGVLGLLRALRDPDVQRTLALAVRIARAVGQASHQTIGNAAPGTKTR